MSIVRAIDAAALRRGLGSRPLLPYEALMAADRWSADTQRQADVLMSAGWRVAGLPRVRLDAPVAWDELVAENRSATFHLHAWDPLGPVLAAYGRTGEGRYLSFAADVVLDWVRAHPSLDVSSEFAWYDHAVGVRAYRLGYVLDAVARADGHADSELEALIGAVQLHLEALADDARFARHSNHGIYQAAGERALARRFPELPGSEAAQRRGGRRLAQLIADQFTLEGVHREHSPGYQLFMAELLGRLLDAELLEREFEPLRRAAEAALAWMLLPNGRFAMFGDTSHAFPANVGPDDVRDPALKFMLSRGAVGRPPHERVRGFEAAGLFVARDGWRGSGEEAAGESYLAQTCAFHSRAHKHADDLTFVWYDRGRELVTDSGRYGFLGKTEPESRLWKLGFNYSDPKRVYVESTRAHNTVEIDGESHRRRDVVPYGSALRSFGETGGVAYSEAEVVHGPVRHRRVLAFRPGSWLLVLDWLGDKRHGSHRFDQRFHFAPELEAVAAGSSVRIDLPDDDASLFAAPLLPGATLDGPVKGQEDPELLGWVSRSSFSLVPAATASYVVEGARHHVFATLLSLSTEQPQPSPGNDADPEAGRAALAWRLAGAEHAVVVDRGEDGELRLVAEAP